MGKLQQNGVFKGPYSGYYETFIDVPFTSAVGQNNLLVLCISLCTPYTQRVTDIVDSQGNVWLQAVQHDAPPGADTDMEIWYAVAKADGSVTPRATVTGYVTSSQWWAYAYEFDGTATSSPLDTADDNAGDVSLTVANDNSVIVAAGMVSSGMFEQYTGYTSYYPASRGVGLYAYDNAEYRTDAPSGTQTVRFSVTPAHVVAAAFKPAGVGVTLVDVAPTADVAAGNWTKSTGGGTDLYTMIDDASPDTSGTDYIQSGANPSGDVCKVRFTTLQTPSANTDHKVTYVIKRDGGVSLTVTLKGGDGTTIKEWTHTGAGDTDWTEYNQTLSTTEADDWATHGYANSELWFTAG